MWTVVAVNECALTKWNETHWRIFILWCFGTVQFSCIRLYSQITVQCLTELEQQVDKLLNGLLNTLTNLIDLSKLRCFSNSKRLEKTKDGLCAQLHFISRKQIVMTATHRLSYLLLGTIPQGQTSVSPMFHHPYHHLIVHSIHTPTTHPSTFLHPPYQVPCTSRDVHPTYLRNVVAQVYTLTYWVAIQYIVPTITQMFQGFNSRYRNCRLKKLWFNVELL